MAKIELTRRRAFFASALSYKVMVDGQCIGTIDNGVTAVFNVASGAHSLRIEVDAEQSLPLRSPMDPAKLRTVDIPMGSHNTYSNTLDLDLDYGEKQRFEVKNSGGIGGFVEGVFTKSHQGLTLRRL